MEEIEYGVPSVFVITLTQILVACLLFIALLYGQRDLAMLTLLVLGVMSGVRLWTRISLSGLTCHSVVDKQKVFPDERVTLGVKAENRKFLPIWLQVIFPIRGLMHLSAHPKILKKESSLLWYQRTHFQWELTAHRRGVHQIGPLHVLAGDLLAFFSREKRTEKSHQIIVYPRLVPLKPFPLPRRDFFGIPGARSPVQDPVYILGTRDYQPGQPAKHIHWKASARLGRLQEKVLESTQQEKALLVLDVDGFARQNAEEEFERTVEAVASLAAQLDRRGLAVGLATNGNAVGQSSPLVPIARNHHQLAALLEALARVEMKTRRDLLDIMQRGSILTWGVSCVHFSYEDDATLALAQEYYRRSKSPAVFFVCHSQAPPGGQRKIYPLGDLFFGKAGGK